MPISSEPPATNFSTPVVGVTGTADAWVRPGELLVELGAQAVLDAELRSRGGRPYLPGRVGEDWRQRSGGPNYGDINARLERVGLGFRLWTGFTTQTAAMMAEDTALPGVHYNTVMTAEDFYQGGGGGSVVAAVAPDTVQEASGTGASLAVLDTGVPENWRLTHPTLKNAIHEVGGLAANTDPLNENGDDQLDKRAGHGLFICGLIVRMDPSLNVQVFRVMHSTGETDDTLVCPALAESTAPVVNLSLGGYSLDDKPSALMAATVARAVARGQVIVAAAGNAGGATPGPNSHFFNRPFWPAALPDVIAVGAFDSRNHGRVLWPESNAADVYAPGVTLRSTYVDGWPDPSGGSPFKGWAQWNGTSFAAPLVAATIAGAAGVASGSAHDIALGWLTGLGTPPQPWPKKPGGTLTAKIYPPAPDLTIW
jgi:hypothetical protein